MGGEGRGGEEGGGEGRRGEVRTCREEKRGGEGRGGGNGGWWWEQRRIWDTEVYLDTITKDNNTEVLLCAACFQRLSERALQLVAGYAGRCGTFELHSLNLDA